MNQRYTLFICLINLIFQSAFSQTPEDNLSKYWQYRNLFKKQFVFVGENPGEGIPFATLHPNEDISWNGTWDRQLECFPRPSGIGAITTGDATLQIGIYLGVLATEYALLKPLGYSTSGIEREIYHAIKAFERLDLGAEAYFGNPGPNDPTFFLRDDIPFGFARDSEEKYWIRNWIAANPADSLIHVVKGDFTCANLSEEAKYPGVTSQDQVAHLSLGFTLLQGYLDNEAQFNGVGLKEYGRVVYRRLYDGFKANGFVAGKPVQLPNSWRLDYRSLIQAGYPFKRVINLFFGGNEFNPGTDRNNWLNLFLPGYLLNPDKPYNAAMGFIWAAIGDAINSENWLATETKKRHLEVYALLHACIHNKNVGADLPEAHFRNLLDVAPCNIPCSYAPSGCPTPENVDWNAGYRWTNNNRNSNQDWQRGFFNGIDYMLLYNLYHLKYNPGVAYYPPAPPPCDFYAAIPFDSIPQRINTGRTGINTNPQIAVYPNPAQQYIQLVLPNEWTGLQPSIVVHIYSISGALMQSSVIKGNAATHQLDVSGLPPQMYFIELSSSESTYSGKFIKH
jgi:hypothetical protein